MKKLKTYMPFAANSFQAQLAYKGNTVMFILGESVVIIVTAFLWKAIYSSSEDAVMNGFTLSEMIIYMLMAFITNLLIHNDCISSIYREVKDGSVAMNLIKPISYTKRLLFQSLGQVFFNFVVVFLAVFIVMTIVYARITGSINILNIILYFVSAILSMLINFFYCYCFGLLAFKITNMWGLNQIMGAIINLLSGSLIPLAFFPDVVTKVFNLLPFSSIISTPTLIYLGKLSYQDAIKALLLQVIWVVLFMLLSKWIWKKLIKQITILGG